MLHGSSLHAFHQRGDGAWDTFPGSSLTSEARLSSQFRNCQTSYLPLLSGLKLCSVRPPIYSKALSAISSKHPSKKPSFVSLPAHLHSSKLSNQWLWLWVCVQTTGFFICFWCPWDLNTGIPKGLWPRLVMPFAARRQPWTIFHTIPSHPLLASYPLGSFILLFLGSHKWAMMPNFGESRYKKS